MLIDQPELLSSVNFIPGIYFGKFPIVLVVGFAFLVVLIFLLLLKKKLIFTEKNFSSIFIALVTVFWIPLYLNFLYNNIYDAQENYIASKFDLNGKRILRLCNIDHRQNFGGALCQLPTFIKYTMNNIALGENIKVISPDSLRTYLYYYLNPYYGLVVESDIVLLYFSQEYRFENNTLYKREYIVDDNSSGTIHEIEIGKYTSLHVMDANRMILKKL